MDRRNFIFSGIVGIVALPALAQENPLNQTEILNLLSGNTAVGLWQGTDYRQWFGADGSTIYAPKGQRSTLGKWRVTSDGVYESWWSGDEWESYRVRLTEQTYVWVDAIGQEHPFSIVPGQQLVWPTN